MESELNLMVREVIKEPITTHDGRVKLGQRQQIELINMALQGKTQRQIRINLDLTPLEFHDLLNNNAKFKQLYIACKNVGIHELVDELVEIPHSALSVKSQQLLSENIRWIASKRNKDDYGDKIDVTVEHISVKDALSEAKKRAIELKRSEFGILDDENKEEDEQLQDDNNGSTSDT